MSDDAMIDLIENPNQLRQIFNPVPYDPEAPASREPQIDIPEAPPSPPVVCHVEIRLQVRFDPWQIDRIPQEQLRQIIWATLTRDEQYYGGIVPDLTFISMFLERIEPDAGRRPWDRPVERAPDRPQHTGDRGDDDDAGDFGGRIEQPGPSGADEAG